MYVEYLTVYFMHTVIYVEVIIAKGQITFLLA